MILVLVVVGCPFFLLYHAWAERDKKGSFDIPDYSPKESGEIIFNFISSVLKGWILNFKPTDNPIKHISYFL